MADITAAVGNDVRKTHVTFYAAKATSMAMQFAVEFVVEQDSSFQP